MGHPFIDRAQRTNLYRMVLRRLLIPCLLCIGVVGYPTATAAAGPAPYVVTRTANSGGFNLQLAFDMANALLYAQIAQAGAICINRSQKISGTAGTPYGLVYTVTASA